MHKIAAIILAGGFSRRFGTPKPFLKFDESYTFLQKLTKVYSEFGLNITIIIANSELKDKLGITDLHKDNSSPKIIWNYNPNLGRFYSIKLGAQALDNNIERCFIQNVDNPFTDVNTLNLLYQAAGNQAYVSPVYDGKGGHPILVSGEVIDSIRNEKDIAINFKDFLSQFKRKRVEVSNGKALANINTPDDYTEYFNCAI